MNNSQGLKTAWTLFCLQSLITVLMSIISGIMYGRPGVVAAWMGGLSVILPAATSAQILFRGSLWDTPRQWLNRFVRGQVMKLVLSMLVSGFILYIIDPLPGIMFVTWACVSLAYRLLALWSGKHNKVRIESL